MHDKNRSEKRDMISVLWTQAYESNTQGSFVNR